MARWSLVEHPASVGETYSQHMRNAAGFGAHLIEITRLVPHRSNAPGRSRREVTERSPS